MSEIRFKKIVHAPIQHVFAAFSDFENAAERVKEIESVEMLTDGPVGVGTRFRETRLIFGREASEELEVTKFVAPESMAIEAVSCGSHYRTDFGFQTLEGGRTQVDVLLRVTPRTLIAKMMKPLAFLMKRTMRKMLDADFEQIKQFSESQFEMHSK
jgi:uncharacterized membrane protein